MLPAFWSTCWLCNGARKPPGIYKEKLTDEEEKELNTWIKQDIIAHEAIVICIINSHFAKKYMIAILFNNLLPSWDSFVSI